MLLHAPFWRLKNARYEKTVTDYYIVWVIFDLFLI